MESKIVDTGDTAVADDAANRRKTFTLGHIYRSAGWISDGWQQHSIKRLSEVTMLALHLTQLKCVSCWSMQFRARAQHSGGSAWSWQRCLYEAHRLKVCTWLCDVILIFLTENVASWKPRHDTSMTHILVFCEGSMFCVTTNRLWKLKQNISDLTTITRFS